MLLITAECDPLTDDCLAFAARVRAEGGEVAHREVAGVIHGFLTLGRLFPEADAVVAEIGAAATFVIVSGRGALCPQPEQDA